MTPSPDARLDAMLHAAAPSVAAHEPDVRDEIAAMIVASRTAAPTARRPWWRRKRIAIGGIAALLVIGSASTALATNAFRWDPIVRDPDNQWSITLADGTTCVTRLKIYPRDGIVGVPPVPLDDPTLVAARAVLGSIRVQDLDIVGTRHWMTENDLFNPYETADQQDWDVVDQAMTREFDARATKAGLDQTQYNTRGEGHCEAAK